MTFQRQADFGTPASKRAATVTLTIDGRQVTVPEGTSLMRAAAEMGTSIPKLCATDSLKSFGSCRLCLVEIDGRKGTPASCTTPAEEGMVVHTQTPLLHKLRKGVMELYISDHPLDCLTCAANGDCELQDQAGAVGLRDVRYAPVETHLGQAKDQSNPYFDFDPSKCIVCSRCVRACDEVQGTLALTIQGRGWDSKVSAGLASDDFLGSECVSCGACVDACPTATLIEKSVVEIGTPERSVVTTCAYCGVGCSFRAEMRGEQLVRMVPWKDGKPNRGHSCVKGRFAWGYAQHQEPNKEPVPPDPGPGWDPLWGGSRDTVPEGNSPRTGKRPPWEVCRRPVNLIRTGDKNSIEVSFLSIVLTVLLIIVNIQFILVFVIIFDQRRNPTSTVGWILVLLLLPVLGFFLYLFLGQDWTKRRLFSMKAQDDQRLAEEVRSQKKELERIAREHRGDLYERFLSIARMLLESNQAIITNDNALTIFTDGKAKFESLFDAIRAAKHHIHLEYYIIRDDPLSRELIQLLTCPFWTSRS